MNKIDALDKTSLEKRRSELLKLTNDIYAVSTISGDGMMALLRSVNSSVSDIRALQSELDGKSKAWSP